MRFILPLSLLAVSAAQAGIINSWSLGGPVTGSVSAFTFAQNNDNVVGPSPNIVFGNLNVTALTSSILTPVLGVSGGTTEYAVYLGIFNNTTTAWRGMLLEIYAGTTLVTTNGFDFDFPQFDSPNSSNVGWGLIPPTPLAGQLHFEGPDLAVGNSVTLTFNLDVPDPGGLAYSVRMTPLPANAPEPSTWAAAITGLALVAFGRAKRR